MIFQYTYTLSPEEKEEKKSRCVAVCPSADTNHHQAQEGAGSA